MISPTPVPTALNDDTLAARVEDAGLNAAATPMQRWMDGWIVRLSPGKAKRARCINAVALGRRPMDEKLAECEALYAAVGLPMFFRVTPFSAPPDLSDALGRRGFHRMDETLVMVAEQGAGPFGNGASPPPGIESRLADAADFAAVVGALRASPVDQIAAQARRVAASPVPYRGLVWTRDGVPVACGQVAVEGRLAGLYDVFTAPSARGQGLSTALCTQLLSLAREAGADIAYLQVDADNAPARTVYRRLGFSDRYSYHYRCREAGAH